VTAPQLLQRLIDSCTPPAMDGPELVFTVEPPAELVPIIQILAMPLVAILTGRHLIAIDENGRSCTIAPSGKPGDGICDPRQLLPPSVRLMCVEGFTGGTEFRPSRQKNFRVYSRPQNSIATNDVRPGQRLRAAFLILPKTTEIPPCLAIQRLLPLPPKG
jgi:hypothetical protein